MRFNINEDVNETVRLLSLIVEIFDLTSSLLQRLKGATSSIFLYRQGYVTYVIKIKETDQ